MATHKSLVQKASVEKSSNESTNQNKSEGVYQSTDDRSETNQVQQLQRSADVDTSNNEITQLQSLADNFSSSTAPFQLQENNTGIPDGLKTGMEQLSGMSLDNVNVHYNSDKPATVQAHAYAQGSDIHLASGQEKHLPHELAHVVQQSQGRVKPTTEVNGMKVNDSPALEKEADVMGSKATTYQRKSIKSPDSLNNDKSQNINVKQFVIQRDEDPNVGFALDRADDVNTVAGAVGDVTGAATFSATEAVSSAEAFNKKHATEIALNQGKLKNGETLPADAKKTKTVSKGEQKAADYQKVSDQVVSTIGVANTFVQSFRGGYQAYQEGNISEGGKNALEGAKGIVSAVELAGKFGDEAIAATGNLLPGLASGLSMFQNAITLYSSKEVHKKVTDLNSKIQKEEIREISKYLRRVSLKIGEELLDFIFNATEVITAAFPAAFGAVKAIHSCVNLFKMGAKAYHSYCANKSQQADERVSDGDTESLDDTRDEYKDYHEILKDAGSKSDPKKKASIRSLLLKADAVTKLKAQKDAVLADHEPSEFRENDELFSNFLLLNKGIIQARKNLKLAIDSYNEEFNPSVKINDTNVYQVLKIHKNVISNVLKQAQQEKATLSFFRRKFPENKDKALEEYRAINNGAGNLDPDQINLEEIEKLQHNDYFWDKTITQVKLVSKRKFYTNEQLLSKIEERLSSNKDLYLDRLVKIDGSKFNKDMKNENQISAYKAAVKEYVNTLKI